MDLKRLEKKIKRNREILSIYLLLNGERWRRILPDNFYISDSILTSDEERYYPLIYEIFLEVLVNSKKAIIEDELNLIYADLNFDTPRLDMASDLVSSIRDRFDLNKQTVETVGALAKKAFDELLNMGSLPRPIRFRLESTTYLVRLLAYGLFTENDVVLDRVAEVFDAEKLISATKPKDKQSLDNSLKFLYKGLIQKNERGRQGSRRAAKQTLKVLREWYYNNDYIISCINKIERYL